MSHAAAARQLIAATIAGGSALIVARELFGWNTALVDDWLLFILFAVAGGFCAWRALAMREERWAWLLIGELHDHVLDVGQLAVAVGRRLGMPEESLPELLHGAELHDVGKIGLPESILRRPGPLDEDEWSFMRRHTLIGERFLLAVPALRSVAALVRSSHERWDGGGYPNGLAGEEIPLGARIIAVCDAFDAMVTDRPYRAGMLRVDAEAELLRCAGSQFDPAVVTAFLAVVGERVEVRETARI
jgi:HD-GYP domain-containing protein (c-di-GMP phosphodiesterase class II)